MRVLFEQTGRRVSIAGTVADAISVASADRPDLMLIDLTLPDGDGLAILEELQRINRAPRVAVALTGHDEPALTSEASELAVADRLSLAADLSPLGSFSTSRSLQAHRGKGAKLTAISCKLSARLCRHDAAVRDLDVESQPSGEKSAASNQP